MTLNVRSHTVPPTLEASAQRFPILPSLARISRLVAEHHGKLAFRQVY